VPLQTALKKGANSIIAIATNAGNGPNAAGFFFDARIRDAAGKETSIITDASWEWSAQAPGGKEGRMAAFDPKDWKPVTVVQALPVWQKTIDAQAPALLAQGAAGSNHMIRASLMKADFLMRTLGRPNRDQIVSTRPNDLTTLEAIDLANGSILADTISKGPNACWRRRRAISSRRFIATRFAAIRSPAELATAKETSWRDADPAIAGRPAVGRVHAAGVSDGAVSH
jgi:hypothetical protein